MELNEDEQLLANKLADSMEGEDAVQWVKDIVIQAEKRAGTDSVRIGGWINVHGTEFQLHAFRLAYNKPPSVEFKHASELLTKD